MSDYCRTKAIMYPIDQTILNRLSLEDAWDLEELKPELFERVKGKPYFEIEAMVDDNWNCAYYLSYVLFYRYGEDSGEFGRNRLLSSAEQEKYKALFEQILPEVDPSKLKYVDYCYYNACESPDFYNSPDDFNDEL